MVWLFIARGALRILKPIIVWEVNKGLTITFMTRDCCILYELSVFIKMGGPLEMDGESVAGKSLSRSRGNNLGIYVPVQALASINPTPLRKAV